jgi:hypothetical protein
VEPRAVDGIGPARTLREHIGNVTRDARTVLVGIALSGLVVGAALSLARPRYLVMGIAAGAIIAVVAARPAVGAYMLILVTPLVAGMSRGTGIPLLRPNEALDVLIGAGLVAGYLLRLKSGAVPRIRMGAVDRTLLLLAVTSSVVPLIWMSIRGQKIESDDLLYSLMVWKYFGVYLIVRAAVHTEKEIRNCLWVSMISGSIVAIVAILQSLHAPFITGFLGKYYVNYGYAASVSNGRGGATLSLPIAVADLLTFNLAIAVGFLWRNLGRRRLLIVMSALFALGAIAGGEFSGAIGLVLGLVVMALVTRRIPRFATLLPILVVGILVLRPVIENRLSGFQSASGVPNSWSARWWALTNIFWPQLFSHAHFVLGIRPAARWATASRAAGYIWIESGYTWLLWAGGIPLVLAFGYFLWKNIGINLAIARGAHDSTGVAAFAVVVALSVVGVLMLIDPHLTYRGSADLLFALLGLSTAGATRIKRSDMGASLADWRFEQIGAP